MKEKNKGWMISAVAGCAVILGAGLGVSAYQREKGRIKVILVGEILGY